MTNSVDIDPPKATRGDLAHTGVRAAVSMIPIVGSPAVELFNLIVAPPIERRRDAWREAVSNKLQELIDRKQLSAEDLQNDEGFISSILQASQAAVKTHEAEKLDALRNAIVNSALPDAPDESLRQIFIRFVDELTVSHLQILTLFSNPAGWFEARGKKKPEYYISSSLVQLLQESYPELASQRTLTDLIVVDLSSRKLWDGGGLHVMMSANGIWQKRTTDLGDRFLRFIAEPVQ